MQNLTPYYSQDCYTFHLRCRCGSKLGQIAREEDPQIAELRRCQQRELGSWILVREEPGSGLYFTGPGR